MRIRKGCGKDIAGAVSLAKRLGLDYPDLERDDLWVAEEDGRVIGLVALKKHADCLELCALGVDPAHRGKGTARALTEALLAEAPGDIYLATVIPGFFEGRGFERAPVAPKAFVEKRNTAWCGGCDARLCAVMVKKVS